ncbi:hypothetical protein B4589_000485 [Halolamina sp. CBA1230]|uniref:hypothetical protein n=1 Tax=Halolamina sp. CBA1230 TaxID=1853690 RepID=UPI0009A1B761|nr:hypothetical protein [Halolamina sp. CBA1230]QKY18919.1 hypothetical protein B4589_000485 [Halolamina sp. CBA1230]
MSFDLSSSAMPDVVFDPEGTAGDSAAKGLNIDSQTGDGVGVVSTDDADVFSQPHNGVNGSDGYDVLTIEFTDFEPGAAEIVDVELHGDPPAETSQVEIGSEGSAATMIVAMADTADSGNVRIATVTLRGEAAGSADLDLTVTALGDEQGHSYTTTAQGTEVTVLEAESSTDTGDDGTPTAAPDGGQQSGGDGGQQSGSNDDGATSGDSDGDAVETTDGDGNTADESTVDEESTGTDAAADTARQGSTPAATSASTERPTTSAGTTVRAEGPGIETATTAPGFGVGAALLALIAVVLALRRGN